MSKPVCAIAAMLWLSFNVTFALAQQSSDITNVDAARAELEVIQTSITLSDERKEALRIEIGEIEGDRTRQNAALIAAGQRAQLVEIEVAAIEERLTALLTSEATIRTRLDGADTNTANLLAALQRLGSKPPPVLLVNPSDAVSSARSALLMTAILPQLGAKTKSVTDDLKQLVAVKNAAETEEEELRTNLTLLNEEQLRIATLIEARKIGLSQASVRLTVEEHSAEALALVASSLGDLIEQLSEEDTKAANKQALGGTLDDEAIRVALADTGRTEPAFPFNAGRGHLTIPATGIVVTQFGGDDSFGGTTEGISMVTRANAQVIAPADGWVMYKGPYLNYGQIIILNPGQQYSILLAGLSETSVELGQFVMMGEPVGEMGSRTIGQGVTTNAGVSRPTLYIEFRQEDTPINPQGWWAEKSDQTQNG